MRISDWSSDVCSSDLAFTPIGRRLHGGIDNRLRGRKAWIGMVLFGRVLDEKLGKPLLPGRMAGGEDRPLQRPHGALKLRRLLTVDLHAQGGPDLTHTLQGRLLGGNDGIDMQHAAIGQKAGLVDRTLGVPDTGKLGSCIRDGSRWRALSDQFST